MIWSCLGAKIWKRLHLIYFIGALWSWITRRRILFDIYLQLGMHHNKAKKCTTNFAAHVRNPTLAYSTEIWRVWSCDISHMLYKRLQVWGYHILRMLYKRWQVWSCDISRMLYKRWLVWGCDISRMLYYSWQIWGYDMSRMRHKRWPIWGCDVRITIQNNCRQGRMP